MTNEEYRRMAVKTLKKWQKCHVEGTIGYDTCRVALEALEYSDKLWEKAYKRGRESMLRDLKITNEVHEEAVVAVNNAMSNIVKFLNSGNIEIKAWLISFNTDSATECFTAVQKLKERVNENEQR